MEKALETNVRITISTMNKGQLIENSIYFQKQDTTYTKETVDTMLSQNLSNDMIKLLVKN